MKSQKIAATLAKVARTGAYVTHRTPVSASDRIAQIGSALGSKQQSHRGADACSNQQKSDNGSRPCASWFFRRLLRIVSISLVFVHSCTPLRLLLAGSTLAAITR